MRKTILGLAIAGTLVSGAAAAGGGYRVIQTVDGPDGGWDFARIDPAANRLLVTRGTSVMALDLASGKVTAGLAPGQRLHDAVPVNGGREILVTNGDAGTAVFADAASGAPVATVRTGANPDAAAFDPATGLVLVMNHSDGSIALVDPRTHQLAGRIQVGGDLEMAAPDGSGRAYVNVEDRNETVLVDVAHRKVVRHIRLPGCDGPTGVAYERARQWIIAACDGATDVVDARTGKLVKTLKTGKEADGVAVDARRRLAFVPGREGTLSVISLKGKAPAVIQVLSTEANNRTLAVDERSGRVYLPVAKLAPAAEGQKPAPVPGTFHVLVVGS